jgi:hypothetical protein
MTDEELEAYVTAYAGGEGSWDDDHGSAFAAEKLAQGRACRIPMVLSDPDDPDSELVASYPDDLAEALGRRVVVNLANRGLPLGVQIEQTDVGVAGVRVGGLDREVRRLETPFKRVVLG